MNYLGLRLLPLSTMSTMSTDPRPARASVDIVDIVDGVDRSERTAPEGALVGARLWRIHWPEIEPTVIRYQEAVTLDRVLSEHRAAVGAEPMETEAAGNADLIAGPSMGFQIRVVATPTFL